MVYNGGKSVVTTKDMVIRNADVYTYLDEGV